MAKVDELVVTVSAEVDPSFDKTMKEAENAPKRAESAVDKLSEAYADSSTQGRKSMSAIDRLNKTYDKSSKALELTGKTASTAVDWISRLGVVSAATSGLMAAWSFNAAGNATNLDNMAFSTQLSTQELQEMSSAYRQLGLSADAFYQDALRYQAMYGRSLDSAELMDIADRIQGMDEREALQLLRGMQFSDDSARAIIQSGREGILQAIEKVNRLQLANTDGEIARLKELQTATVSLTDAMKASSNTFQAGLSDNLTPALESLSQIIADNRDIFEKWGRAVGDSASWLVSLIGGERDLDTVIRENGKTANENMASVIPEEREAETLRRDKEANSESFVAFLGELNGGFLPHWNPDDGLIWDPFAAAKRLGKKLDKIWEPYNRSVGINERMSIPVNTRIERISSFDFPEEYRIEPNEQSLLDYEPNGPIYYEPERQREDGSVMPRQQMIEIPRSSSVYNNVINNAGDTNSTASQTTTVNLEGGINIEVSSMDDVAGVVHDVIAQEMQQVAAALPRRG